MLPRKRDAHWLLILLPVVAWSFGGCYATPEGLVPETSSSSSSSSTSSSSSSGDLGPCGEDCSLIETATCLVAVCNTGQVPGPINTCVVVNAPKGTSCDDGKFCTIADQCDGEGSCTGGDQNRCGIKPDPCSSILCYEDLKMCDVTPAGDGAACTPKDLCKVNGVCKTGDCIGEPKDCTFSPMHECNTVACDPNSGKCVGTPDSTKDNASCVLTGDLCQVNKTCLAGKCVGGTPKDCSSLNVGCDVGACDGQTGLCGPAPAPIGTPCTPGTEECQVGACNDKGACIASPAADGTACNDYDACTKATKCANGACTGGSAVAGCSTYVHAQFETCPGGWTLGGDWECGKPTVVGPPDAHIGTGVMATQIAGNYHVNQDFNTTVADSPPLDLTAAITPMLSFWAWDYTEGGSFDGWNVKVSTNGGANFTQIMGVSPAYNLNIAGQPAWGGNHSAEGWRNYMADLTPYIGKTAIVRFSFRSDPATVYPGVYVDDVIVAEPQQIPMYITSSSALPDIYSGMAWSAPIAKIGGTTSSVWSIKAGGQNNGWISIDPATGILSGTPSPADVGQVVLTVHVEEPMLPSNFAEKTFSFKVLSNAYYTSFEGVCPNGWTLTGDWECGTPTMVGPSACYLGAQCIATKIGSFYSNGQTFAGTTATSPDIDLTKIPNPIMTFRLWNDTEGSTYDGVHLSVSTDNGMTYSLVTGVSPAYNFTVAGQPAWGGHLGAYGWQLFQADLSPFAGKVIKVQFGFQSDTSGTFPGIYIDDLFIN